MLKFVITLMIALGVMVSSAEAYHSNDKVSLDGEVASNPCTGEDVTLTGDIHFVVIASDHNGDWRVNSNYENVTGVGSISGNVYHVVGHRTNSEHINDNTGWHKITEYERYVFMEPGGSRFIFTLEVLVYYNGNDTIVVKNGYSTECR